MNEGDDIEAEIADVIKVDKTSISPPPGEDPAHATHDPPDLSEGQSSETKQPVTAGNNNQVAPALDQQVGSDLDQSARDLLGSGDRIFEVEASVGEKSVLVDKLKAAAASIKPDPD